jgi:hypothetical protein
MGARFQVMELPLELRHLRVQSLVLLLEIANANDQLLAAANDCLGHFWIPPQ